MLILVNAQTRRMVIKDNAEAIVISAVTFIGIILSQMSLEDMYSYSLEWIPTIQEGASPLK